jgi:predicted HD phosphohydrolase
MCNKQSARVKMDHVKFTQMKDGDAEDYAFLAQLEAEFAATTADRLLKALRELDQSLSGYKISRLDHSLSAATRAWRAGADSDWVVAALFHDIGDVYAPYNHDEFAASILRPFVREQCSWVVEKHGAFQLVYYGAYVGANPRKRDAYRGHAYFEDCCAFCEVWDQPSFDPDCDAEDLEFFAPVVKEVFARKPNDPAVIRSGRRLPLADAETAASRRIMWLNRKPPPAG